MIDDLQHKHIGHFQEMGLDFKRVKKPAPKFHKYYVMLIINYADRFVHTRRTLFSTVVQFRQEPARSIHVTLMTPNKLILTLVEDNNSVPGNKWLLF
jgi:hypothetical protein